MEKRFWLPSGRTKTPLLTKNVFKETKPEKGATRKGSNNGERTWIENWDPSVAATWKKEMGVLATEIPEEELKG